MQLKRTSSPDLTVEKLPDGSTAIFDATTKTVYSLNSTAAAAWDASAGAATLAQVVETMQRSFNPGITEEVALDALFQLQEKGLVELIAPPPGTSRRSMIATAAGIVAPVVLALTGAQQRAFAQVAVSGDSGPRPT